MTVLYDSDSIADFDELIDAIEAVADTAGWTTVKETTMDGENPAGGADAGQILTLDQGDDFYVRLQSVANLQDVSIPESWSGGLGPNIAGPGVLVAGIFDDGEDPATNVAGPLFGSKYIGPATFQAITSPVSAGWVAPTFPATYHIFAPDDPPCIFVVVQTNPTHYQWIKFGRIVKFGTWTGGGFFGATMSQASTSGGTFARQPLYSVDGASRVHSHAPWHRMRSNFNTSERPDNTSNTHVHCVTGTSEPDIDDTPWTYNSIVEPSGPGGDRREAVANVVQVPLNTRGPNSFNQVSVMVPYWLSTQRESHRVLIGRVPHCRHLPIDNFNAGDTFQLGDDEWMVFPYFERGGLTDRYGWAIKKSDGS